LAVENGFPVVLYADDGPAFREDDLSAFSALDSFPAPADWTRESFNFEIGVRLA